MKTNDFQSKSSGEILKGTDLTEASKATIKMVDTVVFGQGTEDERRALQLHVMSNEEAFEGQKKFALGARTVDYLTEELGEDTDSWLNKTIQISPVASQDPKGKPTTSISVRVPKAKK